MPIKEKRSGLLIIPLTIILSLMLAIMPLPDWAAYFQPQWPLLFVIYWCLALPHRIGMIVAWMVGLLHDVMIGGNHFLGQYALSMALILYIVLHIHKRMRISPLFQQAITVFILIIFYKLLVFFFESLTGNVRRDLDYWLLSPASSLIMWPWIFIFLRSIRRRFRIQ